MVRTPRRRRVPWAPAGALHDLYVSRVSTRSRSICGVVIRYYYSVPYGISFMDITVAPPLNNDRMIIQFS